VIGENIRVDAAGPFTDDGLVASDRTSIPSLVTFVAVLAVMIEGVPG
jgi:hypothetical protein